MSGIGAIFRLDHRLPTDEDRRDLSAMASSLETFGHEQTSTAWFGPVGLAHTLHGNLTPEDRFEHQPVTWLDRRYALIFDGRIDNRSELAATVGWSATHLLTASDSALFAAAWQAHGRQAAQHVVGPYAVITVDLERREIHLVRDPLGQRVMYWHRSPERFVVASSAAPIHATGVDRRIDRTKLADSLVLNYRDEQRSFFVDVHRLRRGEQLTVDRDAQRSTTVDVCDNLRADPLILKSDREYVEAAQHALDAATRAMTRTTAIPSISLSSGLDSTMVAISARSALRAQGERLHAYTSVPLDRWTPRPDTHRQGDESVCVDAFLAMYPDIVHRYVRADGRGLLDYLDPLIAAAGSPPRNALNLHWIHEIHRLTRQRNARVVLTGDMGNATIGYSGHGLERELLRRLALVKLFRELRGSPATIPILQPLLRSLVLPSLPTGVLSAIEHLRGHKRSRLETYSALNLHTPIARRALDRVNELGFDSGFRRASQRPTHMTNMLGNALTEAADIHQAMRSIHGTEIRDPTADLRVVELAFRLPTDQYQRNGTTRWLQRRLLAGRVPDEILNGPRGRQAADARLRVVDELDELRDDLDEFAATDDFGDLLDLDGLRALVDDRGFWDSDMDPQPDSRRDVVRLSRAVATGRFYRHVTAPQPQLSTAALAVEEPEAVRLKRNSEQSRDRSGE